MIPKAIHAFFVSVQGRRLAKHMADDGPAPKRQRVSSSQPIAESWEDLLEDRGSRGHSNGGHSGHGGGGFRGQGGGGGAHGASPDMFVGDYGNSGLVAMVGVTVPEVPYRDFVLSFLSLIM